MRFPKPLLSPEERRARKLERRAKQREANVGRAAKMHAVRVSAEHRQSLPGVIREPSAEPEIAIPRWNVGCSGWFYWHWRERFYPAGMTTKEWFGHYANEFDTVELNAPFYSWPTAATVQSWVRQAQEKRFVYTVKVCELITHVKQFVRTRTLVKDFCFLDRWVGPHMGCFLFQLPPSFHFSLPRLTRIVDQLDPARRNVVEFRHAKLVEEVIRAFKKANIIFCSCSAPRLPDELIQTADEIYIRFHGKTRWYRHDYSAEELAIWTKRIRARDPTRVWAYFNNDFGGFAIQNARELTRQLKEM